MPPISAASARLRPSATAASAKSRRHCRVSRLCRAKARKSSALKSPRRAIAAAIGLVSFIAESKTTRNHKPPRAGNPLNESEATTAGITGSRSQTWPVAAHPRATRNRPQRHVLGSAASICASAIPGLVRNTTSSGTPAFARRSLSAARSSATSSHGDCLTECSSDWCSALVRSGRRRAAIEIRALPCNFGRRVRQ